MLVYLCSVCLSRFVCLVLSVCPALSIVQAVKHETLTQCWANLAGTASMKYCLGLNGYWPNAGPSFNRHWVSVGLYSPPAVLKQYQPSKHGTLKQCWFNFVIASQMVAQHLTCLNQHCFNVPCLLGDQRAIERSPENMRRWTSAGLMLGQRRWRRASIGLALSQRPVFAGSVDKPHCVSHVSTCFQNGIINLA